MHLLWASVLAGCGVLTDNSQLLGGMWAKLQKYTGIPRSGAISTLMPSPGLPKANAGTLTRYHTCYRRHRSCSPLSQNTSGIQIFLFVNKTPPRAEIAQNGTEWRAALCTYFSMGNQCTSVTLTLSDTNVRVTHFITLCHSAPHCAPLKPSCGGEVYGGFKPWLVCRDSCRSFSVNRHRICVSQMVLI